MPEQENNDHYENETPITSQEECRDFFAECHGVTDDVRGAAIGGDEDAQAQVDMSNHIADKFWND